MIKGECLNQCFCKGKLFEMGEVTTFKSKDEMNSNFEFLEEVKSSKEAVKGESKGSKKSSS